MAHRGRPKDHVYGANPEAEHWDDGAIRPVSELIIDSLSPTLPEERNHIRMSQGLRRLDALQDLA